MPRVIWPSWAAVVMAAGNKPERDTTERGRGPAKHAG